ncbi:cyclodehydratase [Mycolicibacterium thermoresistibile]
MTRYVLDAALPVLLRPDGDVQVGWHPQRAVRVRPPGGLTAAALRDLLLSLQTGATLEQLYRQAACRGADEPAVLRDVVTALIDAGLIHARRRRSTRSASIRVHGRGPLSDLLAGSLRCAGTRVQHSSRSHAMSPRGTDLVVLADDLVTDPRVVRDLHTARLPHLPVRVRDHTGLIGPLVIPGVTSCLGCGDLHRTDRDAAWPAVAAQLRGTVGAADRATVLATAALALDQVNHVVQAVLDDTASAVPPPTLDTTLEFDVSARTIVMRRWSRHPRCSC